MSSSAIAVGDSSPGHELQSTTLDFTSETAPAWAYRLPDGPAAAHARSVRRFVAHTAPFKLAG